MEKPADNQHPIDDLLRRRWSPVGFSDQAVSSEQLASLMEAARWAASSYNEQPWSFVVATKDNPAEFQKALDCLVEGNITWAQAAPVLILTVANSQFGRNGKPNRHAIHDVGLAVGNLSIQATAMGLAVHQMAGFMPDRARETYAIPEAWEPVTMIALGHPAALENLPETLRGRDASPRFRKPLSDFVFSETWGQKAPFLNG